MGWWLMAAALYNVAWGALVVGFPRAPFRWARMEAPTYPEVWQCLGMVVSVYGLLYLVAALDPLGQWPVVAVGLLGKVLGPLGFSWAAAHGALPLGSRPDHPDERRDLVDSLRRSTSARGPRRPRGAAARRGDSPGRSALPGRRAGGGGVNRR